MMYLIPKNIKVKREIFKGFGIFEIIAVTISLGLGFLLQMLVSGFRLKIMVFFILPLLVFLLFMPLPNGSTFLKIFRKYLKYQFNQKKYKIKEGYK